MKANKRIQARTIEKVNNLLKEEKHNSQTSVSPRYISASRSYCLPWLTTEKFMTTLLKSQSGGV